MFKVNNFFVGKYLCGIYFLLSAISKKKKKRNQISNNNQMKRRKITSLSSSKYNKSTPWVNSDSKHFHS